MESDDADLNNLILQGNWKQDIGSGHPAKYNKNPAYFATF